MVESRYLLLVIGSLAFNYTLSRVIVRYRDSGRLKLAKATLCAAIAGNLGLLGHYKYTAFVLDTANALTGTGFTVPAVVLPLAISFFTFQQIAYQVDIYRGLARGTDWLSYSVFVLFFPQLIAGPIVHHSEMMPQFERRKASLLSREDFAIGVTIFILGLAKKVVIADNMALMADPVFDAAVDGERIDFFGAWVGSLAYTYQLYFYFYFSGYSDMAVGIARMFGITLPINFFSPYKATSIIDLYGIPGFPFLQIIKNIYLIHREYSGGDS